MMATTHQLVGISCALGTITMCNNTNLDLSTPEELAIFSVSVLFGALLPDIDEPKSKLGRKLPLISYPMNWMFGHREITHSILFIIITAILGVIINMFIEWSFILPFGLMIGVFSHILGDYFADSGVPLFAPFSKKRYKFFVTLNTRGLIEKIIAIGLMVLNFKWIIYLFEKGYF